jgi:hypothetical protein
MIKESKKLNEASTTEAPAKDFPAAYDKVMDGVYDIRKILANLSLSGAELDNLQSILDNAVQSLKEVNQALEDAGMFDYEYTGESLDPKSVKCPCGSTNVKKIDGSDEWECLDCGGKFKPEEECDDLDTEELELAVDEDTTPASGSQDLTGKTATYKYDASKPSDELKTRDGKTAKVGNFDKDNGTYEVTFDDGSEYDAYPDELQTEKR